MTLVPSVGEQGWTYVIRYRCQQGRYSRCALFAGLIEIHGKRRYLYHILQSLQQKKNVHELMLPHPLSEA